MRFNKYLFCVKLSGYDAGKYIAYAQQSKQPEHCCNAKRFLELLVMVVVVGVVVILVVVKEVVG